MAICHQIIEYKLKIDSLSPEIWKWVFATKKVGICYESEYLLRNMFSQINEKKLTESNETKMEAIPLSKRRPYVQKLLFKRLKMNFYEENNFRTF